MPLGPFRIVLKIHGDIRSSRCTTSVVDPGGAPGGDFQGLGEDDL